MLHYQLWEIDFKPVNWLITHCSTHLVVACGSANNEGWGARGWPNIVTHHLEPMPKNEVCSMFGLEEHSAEVRMLRQATELNPLELHDVHGKFVQRREGRAISKSKEFEEALGVYNSSRPM
jgi:hypothetical protein